MAELVERHMESMTEELDELRRLKLYSHNEIRCILRFRREFEYKVNGIHKTLQDFIDYITYEQTLVRQIRLRRDTNQVSERKSIEHKVLKRIKSLFEIALQRYPTEVPLCLSYFKFCKQCKYINSAKVAVQNMLKNCAQSPEVWQLAAGWYANDKNDINTALSVLNKGLTLHKDSKLLYRQAIQIEILALRKSEEKDFQIRNCAKIATYVNFICKTINDSSFWIEILNLLEPYQCTEAIQNHIIDQLMENYFNADIVWHTLAQRERKGLHYGDEPTDKSCFDLCIEKYQEGLHKVSFSEKSNLWAMYLDCLAEWKEEKNENTILTTDKRILLKTALKQAFSENCLTEKHFVLWLELSSDNEALEILENAIVNIPQSVNLWTLYLKYLALAKESDRLREAFEKGVKILKSQSLQLWLICLEYYSSLNAEDNIEEIYSEGIQEASGTSNVLKPKYLQWLAEVKGIDAARNTYNELSERQPYCKELHVVMSELETKAKNSDYSKCVRVYERACRQFGKEDISVWIQYIAVIVQSKAAYDTNQKVQRIVKEALDTLDTSLHADFMETYSKTLSEL